jgi:FkbM family methyltransferase
MISVRLPGIAPFSLELHSAPDPFQSTQLSQAGVWEPLETATALALLKPGDSFLDLGANLGYYTLLAARRVGGEGRVYAFEPDPEAFALLQRNVAVNGYGDGTRQTGDAGRASVQTELLAASDITGPALLHRSPDNPGDHRLYDSGDGRPTCPVAAVRLDDYFARMGPSSVAAQGLRLVKMDTQGSEVRVLRGMDGLLSEHRARLCWLVEFWPLGLERCGTSAAELVDRLAGLDLALALVHEGEGRLLPTTPDALLSLAQEGLRPETGLFLNLLGMPRRETEHWARLLAATRPAKALPSPPLTATSGPGSSTTPNPPRTKSRDSPR